MLDLKSMGERIRELRRKSGLTQSDFAEMMSVSFQAVSNWERGIAPPELGNLIMIADRFGVSVDSLLRPVGEDYFIGVDGGGTKTEFALVTKDGYVEKRIVKEGCNPNDVGYDKMRDTVRGGILEITTGCPTVKAIFCGIAGTSVGDSAKRLCFDLKESFPSARIQIKSDAFNLFGSMDGVDMAIISGTGSVAFVKRDDAYVRIGGWGYMLGDEGSGFGIGRDAICQALKEEDLKKNPSLTSEILRQKLGSNTVFEQINTIYRQGRPYVAKLSSAVFEAYSHRDSAAIEIIDKNAKALADLLNTGVGLYGAQPRSIASGGIFERYRDIMLPHIRKYTTVEILFTGLSPVYGACRSACSLVGIKTDEGFLDNFRKTYGDF